MDLSTLFILLIVGVPAFFMGKSTSGSPLDNLRRPIDSKVFGCITYENMALYQLVFNELVKELLTTRNTRLADYDILKIEEIKNRFPFHTSIATVYLAIMFQQYLVADEWEREMQQGQWVKLTTHQSSFKDANFFPSAAHFTDLFERVDSVLKKA